MFDKKDLEQIDLKTTGKVFYNLSVKDLVDQALERQEGVLAPSGALIVRTGDRTGRSPKDRYIVENQGIKDKIGWGNINIPLSEERFNDLWKRISDFLKNKELFVADAFAGADTHYRLPVRTITTKAWHSLFAKTLFIKPTEDLLKNFTPGFTIINASDFKLNPEKDGFRSPVAVVINFEKKLVLIAGTEYGGEMKKSIFSVMNFLLPTRGVFPMHCSTNVGKKGDTALFFGLSGTGKTTLSADPKRRLIGDDEHGWSDDGIFNFEGGCYAKCIRLSFDTEPQIFGAIKFGSILENVVYDEKTRLVDYNSDKITENTRATYPLDHIPNCILEGRAGHPKNIFFLTCDAFGVLPPIAKLTSEAAMYHFLSGYTAKVAGTEVGVTEPGATFSACFGAPFLPCPPSVYAELLGRKLEKHKSNCWLVNTGWSGGSFGSGARMKLSTTRALLTAALNGTLDQAEFHPHPIFKVLVPKHCPKVPSEILDPEKTWTSKGAYRETSQKLAKLFIENFSKVSGRVSREVQSAGPQIV